MKFDPGKETLPFSQEDIENKISLLEHIVSLMERHRNRTARCDEYLSFSRKKDVKIHPDHISYDRHFTNHSTFYIPLEWCGIRTSGAILGIYGEKEGLEINTGHIFYGECRESSFETVEKLGDECTRTIRVSIVE